MLILLLVYNLFLPWESFPSYLCNLKDVGVRSFYGDFELLSSNVQFSLNFTHRLAKNADFKVSQVSLGFRKNDCFCTAYCSEWKCSQTLNRGNGKWGRDLCFTAMMLNYIAAISETIVLPGCWQTSAQCVRCILPFSFLFFFLLFLKDTWHNHCEPFIISPAINLFLFFHGKALYKHLKASAAINVLLYSNRNTKTGNYSQGTWPSSPQLQRRGYYSKHVLLLLLSLLLWWTSPGSIHNDRRCVLL